MKALLLAAGLLTASIHAEDGPPPPEPAEPVEEEVRRIAPFQRQLQAPRPRKEPPVERPQGGSYRYDDYAPYGRFSGGLHRHGQWATKPEGKGTTMVFWGDPQKWTEAAVEEHAIVTNPKDGRRWVWLRAYIDQKLGRRYGVITLKAELIRDGTVEDVTPPEGVEGQPYALADFRGPFTVRVWGLIAQDPRVCAANANDDNCDLLKRRKWFWQHTITPVASVTNPCWTNNENKTRAVLRQEEVWWDSTGGWVRGTGQVDALGVPTGNGLRYTGMQTIAKGVGFVWTGADNNCLKSAWDWTDANHAVPLH